MTERDIVAEAKDGNRDAWQQLYEQTCEYMYRYVYSQILDVTQTEDILSESYTKAFINIKKFRGESSFKTWLYHIIKNELYTTYKKKQKVTPLTEEMIEFVGESEITEEEVKRDKKKQQGLQMLVKNILTKLPEIQAEVLNLTFLLGYSVKETAEHLKLTEANVKVIQHRAIKKAREYMIMEM